MEFLRTDFGDFQIYPKFKSKTMKNHYCKTCGLENFSSNEAVSYMCCDCNTINEVEPFVPKPDSDPVNHPSHYTSHPSGVECITVTRHMNFNLGNVLKYIWRADHKDAPLQDLEKALFYLKDEIKRLKKEKISEKA